MPRNSTERGTTQPRDPRICVVGAGPCGLTTIKNLLQLGLRNVVAYDDGEAVGGNWVFDEEPKRTSVYATAHLISSKKLSEFDDYPMPKEYPDFPSHRQMLAYFQSYAENFNVLPSIRLRTRVQEARPCADGGWRVRVAGPDGLSEERFDHLVVCSGHHREPLIPTAAEDFTGHSLHSCQFKRAEPFRDKRVLVVGAGNSGCDIAVEIARVAERCDLSMRRGYYIVPKLAFGRPTDVAVARLRRYLPRRTAQYVISKLISLIVGPWEKYGLQPPRCLPLQMHPTLNTNILSALRDGTVLPRPGIARIEGRTVHFTEGSPEEFDTIIWATGFRHGFPFLDASVVDWEPIEIPPLYLRMMHRRIADLYFIGLFQPVGCIWRLADLQARIAGLQIVGRLTRPADLSDRVEEERRSSRAFFDSAERHLIEVDYHDFRHQLATELADARA